MARQRIVASRHAHRPPVAGGDAAPVGRDDLLGRLRRAVDEAVAGRGLIVLLTGEAGIGKTTLLKEAARYAEGAGARPAWGSGWPGAGVLALDTGPAGARPGLPAVAGGRGN